MKLSMPGRVWYDALDPDASGMAAEIGLPQPRVQKKGRGVTVTYDDVTAEQAGEVADYLQDRAKTLGGQWGIEPMERELYTTMFSVGHRIRRAAGRTSPSSAVGSPGPAGS